MKKAILDLDRPTVRHIVRRLPVSVRLAPDEIDFKNPPQGVCVVEFRIKLYGEDLPDRFETKEGEQIHYITLDELRDLIGGVK